MSISDLWIEMVSESLEDHGIAATREQIVGLASDIEGMRESVSMMTYTPEDPRIGEIEKLQKDLQKERDKRTCAICRGTGDDTHSVGNSHMSYSRCWKCGGDGRL